ncbi:hypothetical protein [Geothrix sp. PMB-07]|uniref:hypothetical protein n=1 Tax=Geothrix sp. PMB-07 TaxID=3068640 RepID=UPI002740E501|nr:hypothetical protein [Geothrix sp. PMB-07]WLT31127.1 hypothetical protein Q9293_15530 [Geothrix sp. PMB-07]
MNTEKRGGAAGCLKCSFFNGARDNSPRLFTGTWLHLRERLEAANTPRRGTEGDEAKKSLPAISGTRFKAGAKRGRENALELGLLLFDFDNSEEEPTGEFWPDPRTGMASNRPKLRKVMIPEPVTFEEVQEALWDAGVDSYTWSTWSNRPAWPKFRVLVPLAHPVPAELWEAASEWAINRLGFGVIRRGVDMPVLRDTARLNFLPGAPDPGTIRRGETQGEHLAIPLARITPAAVPPLPVAPWQADIQAERKARKDAGDGWWKPYRVGGRPVDFRALDLVSLLTAKGIRAGAPRAFKSGTRWRCSCPLAQEHSGGMDDDSAVIIQTPGQWPSFHCSHSHHAHLGLQDLIELVWGRP